jgi:hypothetical protein
MTREIFHLDLMVERYLPPGRKCEFQQGIFEV